MRKFPSLLLAVALTLLPTLGFATDLTGSWEGHYAYPATVGALGAPVFFLASLRQEGEKVSGTITEPNTQEGKSTDVLRAKVDGTVNKQSVQFVKTYDGTGGKTHSVRYRGKQTGEKVQGTWTLDSLSGTFEMVRAKK